MIEFFRRVYPRYHEATGGSPCPVIDKISNEAWNGAHKK